MAGCTCRQAGHGLKPVDRADIGGTRHHPMRNPRQGAVGLGDQLGPASLGGGLRRIGSNLHANPTRRWLCTGCRARLGAGRSCGRRHRGGRSRRHGHRLATRQLRRATLSVQHDIGLVAGSIELLAPGIGRGNLVRSGLGRNQASVRDDRILFLAHGQPLYMSLYAIGIVFFCFFYTAVVFNPEETADNLKKNGGSIPGIRPGKRTSDYLEYVLTRITVIGAAYLALVCVLPEWMIAQTGIPLFLGGTSLLIVVNVTVDTISQIQSHLLALQYGDLIKKAKLKGRMR